MRRFFLRRKRLAQTVPFTLKSCAISCTSAAVNSPKGSSTLARLLLPLGEFTAADVQEMAQYFKVNGTV